MDVKRKAKSASQGLFSRRRKVLATVPFVTAAIFSGCSAQTNVNHVLAAKGDKNSIDNLLVEAQADYDAGDFTKAMDLATQAYNISPGDEQTSILLGYIHLSMAGIDPFQLAQRLIDSAKTATATQSTTNLAGTTSQSSAATMKQDLQELENIVGVNNSSDATYLTDPTETDKVGKLGDVTVQIPSCASRARLASDLAHIDQAIAYVCPFVNDASKTANDPRHTCTPSSEPRNASVKANFLWAFAHLKESIDMDAALLNAATGLEQRATEINQTKYTVANISQFASDVQSATAAIEAVFPIAGNGPCAANDQTALWTAVNDLATTSVALSQIAGVPAEMTTKITNAVAAIESVAKMKDNLTTSFTAPLGTQITNQLPNVQNYPTSKTQLCQSLQTLAPTQYQQAKQSGQCS